MAMNLVDALCDPARPVFTIGTAPPREGTSNESAQESAEKFSARCWEYACDGYIVYDIQDEAGRTSLKRPFPYRPTINPCIYGSMVTKASNKGCVIYKSVGEPSMAAFDKWLNACTDLHQHQAVNLVGAATSKMATQGPTLGDAAERVVRSPDCKFGCVTIAERHLSKGQEHLNIQRKVDLGAEWFISQAVYNFGATISLINDYGDLCKSKQVVPKKVLLTFAPCGRRKTVAFIHWLGVSVPPHVENAILEGAPPEGASVAEIKQASAVSVLTCVEILVEGFQSILEATATSGVPLGVNVESVSGYREECEASFTLFVKLQQRLLRFSNKWRFIVRLVDIEPSNQEKATRALYHSHQAMLVNRSSAVQLVSAAGFGVIAALLLLKIRNN